MRIGVDLLGGDVSPANLYRAVLDVATGEGINDTFLVFATSDWMQTFNPLANVHLHKVEEVIQMDEDPLVAIRKKKGASIPIGMKLLKEQKIDAFVSVGNTGALVAAATMTLKLKPNVKRPPLIAELPTKEGRVLVVDIGGYLNPTPHQLFEFAHLASDVWKKHRKEGRPKLGLLNIGSEAKKGTPAHREAFALLRGEESAWDFVGNVEGRDVFEGKVEILVTDGFTGNVFLKTAEGIAAFIFDRLEEKHPLAPLFDYSEYPGARLLGVEGTVIKCHGASSQQALKNGIIAALNSRP